MNKNNKVDYTFVNRYNEANNENLRQKVQRRPDKNEANAAYIANQERRKKIKKARTRKKLINKVLISAGLITSFVIGGVAKTQSIGCNIITSAIGKEDPNKVYPNAYRKLAYYTEPGQTFRYVENETAFYEDLYKTVCESNNYTVDQFVIYANDKYACDISDINKILVENIGVQPSTMLGRFNAKKDAVKAREKGEDIVEEYSKGVSK